ncbi:hypothetical protein BJ912DRAFT_243426 [Pholiota molesta]|nr:hypothetical protein BJ912DRAFT_243426 [Pholiota molesta]
MPKKVPPPPPSPESISIALERNRIRDDSTDDNIRSPPGDWEIEYAPWSGSSQSSSKFESVSCIGEIPKKQANSLTTTFSRVSQMLNAEFGAFPNVEAFVDMKGYLQNIQTELEELERHRQAKGDANAILLPFSSLTWEKLQNMLGVKPPLLQQIDEKKTRLIVECTQKIHRQTYKKDLYNSEAWDHSGVFDGVKLIESLVLPRKEASARFDIDKWVLELGRYLRSEGHWVLIIPEFTIQTASDGKVTPSRLSSIKYGNFNTTLTGVADYAIIARFDQGWSEEAFKTFKSDAMKAPSYNHLAGLLIGINIIVIEAKDLAVKLEAHLPQVVGQCIALMSSASDQLDSARKAVPFYLTNGKIWIFGLVRTLVPSSSPSSDARPLYESFIFPPLDITNDMLVKMLLAWSKLTPSELVQAIIDVLGPQRV